MNSNERKRRWQLALGEAGPLRPLRIGPETECCALGSL